MDDAPAHQPGDRIGSYDVEGLLGTGGLGNVYLGKHRRLDRKAALYVPTGSVCPDRYYELANLLANLDHPNIVRLYDVGAHEGSPYLALQYVEGDDLTSMMAGNARIEVPVLLRIMSAVAGALHHAHDHGVLHRGVKPRVILVSRSGEAILTGFVIPAPGPGGLQPEWKRFGNLPYMSPEHWQDACVPQSDIWSLGAVMFKVLTGRHVLEAETPLEFSRKLLQPDPVELTPLQDRTPAYVVEIVAKCLAKNPDQRYRSGDELRHALDAAIDYLERSDGETGGMPPPSEGQTILIHVEHRESDLPGAFRHYQIGSYRGGGSFGDVYQATERFSGKVVALKVLKREHLADEEAVARFRREATVLSRLTHPNIVRLYNFGRYGATFLVAMELLSGRTLKDLIDERAPVSVEEAVAYVSPALAGLAAMHEAGIVHRDLKPANIAVDGDRVVVFDFGLAHAGDLQTLTMSGVFLGTARYASPEQAATMTVTSATDVYAAGVILYELLTGRVPHEADSTIGVITKIATEPPVPITEHRSDLPRELTDTLDRMLSKSPEARPDAKQAQRALGALL